MKATIKHRFVAIVLLSLAIISGCRKDDGNRNPDFAKQFVGTYNVVTTTNTNCPPVTHLVTITATGCNKLSIYNLGNSSTNSTTVDATVEGSTIMIHEQQINSEHKVWGTGELSSDKNEIAFHYTAKHNLFEGVLGVDKGNRVR